VCNANSISRAVGEGKLVLVVDVLLVEHQHRVLVDTGVDLGDLGRGQRLAHIDAFNLAAKHGPIWQILMGITGVPITAAVILRVGDRGVSTAGPRCPFNSPHLAPCSA
jgi:hypothetical protein